MSFFHHAHGTGTPAQLKQSLVDSGHWCSYAEQFCDEACLNRYLRARNHDVTKASAMLRATLEWRKKEDIDSLKRSDFEDTPFFKEGWVYVDGNDEAGRSIVMFRKRKDKFPLELERVYLRFMMFVIETAIKNMKNGQEQWIWVLDLAVYSPANAPHTSVTLGVLQMLANHYPERLYKAYICNAPAIFQVAYKFISPFVDPVSKSKVEFVHTVDYEPGKAAKSSTSHWWSSSHSHSSSDHGSSTGSSWGSWFGHKADSHSSSKPATQEAATDAAVVINGNTNGSQAAAAAPAAAAAAPAAVPKGPGTFGPFMHHYNTPFDSTRYSQLLTAAGC